MLKPTEDLETVPGGHQDDWPQKEISPGCTAARLACRNWKCGSALPLFSHFLLRSNKKKMFKKTPLKYNVETKNVFCLFCNTKEN